MLAVRHKVRMLAFQWLVNETYAAADERELDICKIKKANPEMPFSPFINAIPVMYIEPVAYGLALMQWKG